MVVRSFSFVFDVIYCHEMLSAFKKSRKYAVYNRLGGMFKSCHSDYSRKPVFMRETAQIRVISLLSFIIIRNNM